MPDDNTIGIDTESVDVGSMPELISVAEGSRVVT